MYMLLLGLLAGVAVGIVISGLLRAASDDIGACCTGNCDQGRNCDCGEDGL